MRKTEIHELITQGVLQDEPDIELWKEELEQLVAERTRQLEDKNIELSTQAEVVNHSRHEAEIANEKAEIANRAKRVFLANKHH